MSDNERERFGRARATDDQRRLRSGHYLEFLNPYPWMSDVEAMVHLELERRQIPFSWRLFDYEAINFRYVMKDFHPEFTMPDYKAAIILLGGFWGNSEDIITQSAMAQVLLEEDGWKAKIVTESEIRTEGAQVAISRLFPEFRNPVIQGEPRELPFGHPDHMDKLRQQLRGMALLRLKLTPEEVNAGISGSRTRRKYRIRRRTDVGRRRPGEDRGGGGVRSGG